MKIFVVFFIFFIIVIIGAILTGLIRLGLSISNQAKLQEEKRINEALFDLRLKAYKYMGIENYNVEKIFAKVNSVVTVKSRQALDKYQCVDFFKDNRDYFVIIRSNFGAKKQLIEIFKKFMKDNPFKDCEVYPKFANELYRYTEDAIEYNVIVKYVSRSNNCLGEKVLKIDSVKLDSIESNPESYMSKAEIKEIETKGLDEKKKQFYSRVNDVIDLANELKDNLLLKKEIATLDNSLSNLFEKAVNSIQKVKKTNSDEWALIEKVILNTERKINEIKKTNEEIVAYYNSCDFAKVKESCKLLMDSQKDFNDYIKNKVETIQKLFGSRIERSETKHEDIYQYIRPYKKTISPFVAEVSQQVFSSAENSPIQYVIKYFYPYKSYYAEQIDNLKILLNEMETLKEAKVIIDNYKKDYEQYLQTVPEVVMQNDEKGFYTRLGFATIDESILKFEYTFSYTSNGGMAHRTFPIPMTEENISEIIKELQNRLSITALAKEQRALMTPKLRLKIKERDNYTCCICKNSTHNEPNLLLEIDHITPISKGGLTIEDNLQTLCWKCNRSKSDKLV